MIKQVNSLFIFLSFELDKKAILGMFYWKFKIFSFSCTCFPYTTILSWVINKKSFLKVHCLLLLTYYLLLFVSWTSCYWYKMSHHKLECLQTSVGMHSCITLMVHEKAQIMWPIFKLLKEILFSFSLTLYISLLFDKHVSS